ncbi:TMPIT-like protein [Ancylostoma ceylanicum]|uniref:TMPIT-like protein n=1 Tax=Ancylostoma ceylanicum TaxID=53326 RepID=A0A0D6LMR5_9BILA|nr:TMPIT-like protein [Ancylostoma ceylanicum]
MTRLGLQGQGRPAQPKANGFLRPVTLDVLSREIAMSLDVEDRTEDIKNNNRKASTHVHPVDPTKKCFYCGREDKKPEPEKKKINNGFYLSIILGNNINLTMSSTERYYFKKDYETFKLRFTLFNLFPLAIAFMFPSRLGSWWVAHHYLACVIGGVALTWPDDASYQAFHSQFLLFAAYICLVQQLQYQYQSGCLRRLHSLGHGDSMDVTLEGFATWMFQGLTFLLPFLAIVYMLELYNAYTLFSIWKSHDCVWQVPALSLLFLIVGVGNIAMVAQIVLHKMTENNTSRVAQILRKYPSMAKIQ